MQTVFLVLHNIRSTHNVGSLLRTADAAGVSEVCLCGYTPDPIDRFGRKRSDIAKVALGAEESVSWKHYKTLQDCINELRQKGVGIVALEQSPNSIDYCSYTPKNSVALIVGNEPDGIEESILTQCDAILEIPMRGKKESLNVSVAAGIALYQLIQD